MERQRKPSPEPLSRHDLLALGREIRSALEELEADGVPNTLEHRDMNPGNIVVSDSRCVFLDWAEACVGPPFFSFQYLIEHCRRLRTRNPHNEASLVSHYRSIWTRLASPEQIGTASKLAPLLAAFAYAAGGFVWHDPENMPSETAAYLRSMIRRMKREADMLRESRVACVP
jgi:Ser/Thr protein kinase RdoA (MazF antagonist)